MTGYQVEVGEENRARQDFVKRVGMHGIQVVSIEKKESYILCLIR